MNFKTILSVIGLVSFLLALLFLSTNYSLKRTIEESSEIQRQYQQDLQEIEKKKVSFIITEGEEETRDYQIIPSPDSTVFSLLEDLSQRENFEISYTIYPEMGVLVESIDGKKNGTEGKYWQYWVNGELPMVAADNFQVSPADVIEWKFEKSEF